MSKVGKIVKGFSTIIVTKDRDLEKEIRETNTKLKNSCIGKGFTFAVVRLYIICDILSSTTRVCSDICDVVFL